MKHYRRQRSLEVDDENFHDSSTGLSISHLRGIRPAPDSGKAKKSDADSHIYHEARSHTRIDPGSNASCPAGLQLLRRNLAGCFWRLSESRVGNRENRRDRLRRRVSCYADKPVPCIRIPVNPCCPDQLSYRLDVFLASVRPGCGYEGATISFFVGDERADQTAVWHAGSSQELNLTAGPRPALFRGSLTLGVEHPIKPFGYLVAILVGLLDTLD